MADMGMGHDGGGAWKAWTTFRVERHDMPMGDMAGMDHGNMDMT